MRDLFVVGTVSLDVLHFGDQTVRSAGGAGMYTALAARHAGCAVTLLAPRPISMPDVLRPVAERVDWRGPSIELEALPRLEIRHHGGGRATLVSAAWGAEAQLVPEQLPKDLSGYCCMHIAALSSAQRQLQFLRACRERGAPMISVGTYARLAYGETAVVKQLFAEADLCFMNENEAKGVFQSIDCIIEQVRPEQVILVTEAERGAIVIHHGQKFVAPTQPVAEVDPTGAGDTFCGTFLAMRCQGTDLPTAAQAGVQQATHMISYHGPTALL